MLSNITVSHIEIMMDKCRSGEITPSEMAFMLGQLGGYMTENERLKSELNEAQKKIQELSTNKSEVKNAKDS